jgi:hypothetical protein
MFPNWETRRCRVHTMDIDSFSVSGTPLFQPLISPAPLLLKNVSTLLVQKTHDQRPHLWPNQRPSFQLPSSIQYLSPLRGLQQYHHTNYRPKTIWRSDKDGVPPFTPLSSAWKIAEMPHRCRNELTKLTITDGQTPAATGTTLAIASGQIWPSSARIYRSP